MSRASLAAARGAVGPSARWLADGVGFEPTRGCPLAVFKTAAIDHSATHPARETPWLQAARGIRIRIVMQSGNGRAEFAVPGLGPCATPLRFQGTNMVLAVKLPEWRQFCLGGAGRRALRRTGWLRMQ